MNILQYITNIDGTYYQEGLYKRHLD